MPITGQHEPGPGIVIVGVEPDSDKVAQRTRLHVNKEMIDHAKGAVRTTIELLGVAAQMSQNVPYLGAISTALTEFLRIQDEVDQYKEECKAAMEDAEQINALIKKFRNKCVVSGEGDGALNDVLREEFAELEGVLLECVVTLQRCKANSTRKRGRLRLYWKRTELLKSVQMCATKLSKAYQRFDRMLRFDVVFLLDDIRNVVGEIQETIRHPRELHLSAAASIPLAWPLRAAPHVFHGREYEVNLAVDLIVKQSPARVAILGPGGIGKTSLALAVLHHPRVKDLYEDQRCFMSCEAITTADSLVHALADAVGFVLGNDSDRASQRLLLHLEAVSGLICLDNLETPLDADKRAVEEFLNEIAALPAIALLITSRDTSIPPIRWTSPPLAHIEPISFDAALATWDSICHGYDDYAVKLVTAVDCMPLAVTLLARLAQVEQGAENVWARWVTERTDLIKSGLEEHRLYNLGTSIELSLKSLPYQQAVDVLAVLCVFPEGLWNSEIDCFGEALKNHVSIRPALLSLKQHSLIYTQDIDQWYNTKTQAIRVLSPIRHYMLQHHSVSDELFLSLIDVLPRLDQRHGTPTRDAYLESGLARGPPCRERCLRIVASDSIAYMSSAEVLSRAFEVACATKPSLNDPELHRRLGVLLRLRGQYRKAWASIERAIELDEVLGHREVLFKDWMQWIYTFRASCAGSEVFELEEEHLNDAQKALDTACRLGYDENQLWDQGLPEYLNLAEVQHAVNEGRQTLRMPTAVL